MPPGSVVLQKRLRRAQVEEFFAKLPPSLIGDRGLRLGALLGAALRALGHEVRLIPAAYVKPFVKRNKTDARDAAAICAALQPPGHALRADQERRAAGGARAGAVAGAAGQAAHAADELRAQPVGRARHRRRAGAARLRRADRSAGRGRRRDPADRWCWRCGCWSGRWRRWRRRSPRWRADHGGGAGAIR